MNSVQAAEETSKIITGIVVKENKAQQFHFFYYWSNSSSQNMNEWVKTQRCQNHLVRRCNYNSSSPESHGSSLQLKVALVIRGLNPNLRIQNFLFKLSEKNSLNSVTKKLLRKRKDLLIPPLRSGVSSARRIRSPTISPPARNAMPGKARCKMQPRGGGCTASQTLSPCFPS